MAAADFHVYDFNNMVGVSVRVCVVPPRNTYVDTSHQKYEYTLSCDTAATVINDYYCWHLRFFLLSVRLKKNI